MVDTTASKVVEFFVFAGSSPVTGIMRLRLKLDVIRRKVFENSEYLRKFLKITKMLLQANEINYFIMLKSKKLGVMSRIRNYCWVSGRSRGVLRVYKVSRFVIKGVSSFKLLPGLRKISF